MKKLLCVLMCVLMALTMSGCGKSNEDKFVFENIELSLPKDYGFAEDEVSGWTHVLYSESTDIGIYIAFYSRESVEQFYGEITVDELAQIYCDGLEQVTTKKENDKLYIITDVETFEEYTVFNYTQLIEKDNGFWTILMDCYGEDKALYENAFAKWCKAITFK